MNVCVVSLGLDLGAKVNRVVWVGAGQHRQLAGGVIQEGNGE